MNNLHRELAPVSAAAWAGIEEEAKRTFARHAAARKSVDVTGPDGPTLAGVGTGHSESIDPPAAGIQATLRAWQPVVELRVPFTLSRSEIDSVERGSQDPDWQPVKDAAKKIAFAEDRAVFDGYPQAKITGVGPASTNPGLTLPAEVRDYPDVVSKALSQLRLAGVGGPVLAAAVGRRVDGGQRDLRSRLPDPRAPGQAARRRHHLGARDRRRAAAVRPRRRLRAAPRPGPVDRLPVPRRRARRALLRRVLHLLRLHHRGQRLHHRLTRSRALPRSGTGPARRGPPSPTP